MKKTVLLLLLFAKMLFGVNTLVNGSFEQPVIGVEPPNHVKSWVGGKIVTYYDSDVNGWETTASDHEMEFWSNGAANVPAFEGNQFIELNANEVAAVYQDIPTIPGKKFNWFVAHRGRNGTDTAVVKIGPPGPLGNGDIVVTMTDSNTAWGTYLGSYEVPAGQTVTRLQFEAVSAAGGQTIGNFLDGFKVGPVVQYKFDECYWLGSGHADVFDSSLNGADAEAMNGAQIETQEKIINHAGKFDGTDDYISSADIGALDFNQTLTFSLWVKPNNAQTVVLMDRSTKSMLQTVTSGWVLTHTASGGFSQKSVVFSIVVDNQLQTVSLTPNGWNDGNWHFVAVRYDGSSLKLIVDDQNASVSISGNVTNASGQILTIAADVSGSNNYAGLIDEVKIFAVALGDDEIMRLKENDLTGNDYTGITRPAVACGTSIGAGTWELVGIPADLRTENNTSVAKVFGNNMNGTYGTDWRIYKREYSDQNNSSWYVNLSDVNTPLSFGAGYWLGSKNAESWDVNDMQAVDYNSSTNGTNDCPSTRCVEVSLTPATLDAAQEDTNGTGPYRYYMTGFTGRAPVSWSDCRLIISDLDGSNRQVLTPSEAENADYMAKQIWQYNPGSGADSNGYTTCDDTTPGSCLLEPYKGFWVELHGSTKSKSVKLLIPKE